MGSRRAVITAAVVVAAALVAVGFWVLRSTSTDPVASQEAGATASESESATEDAGNSSVPLPRTPSPSSGKATASPSPRAQTTAQSFDDLPYDSNEVSSELVAAAACGLRGEYLRSIGGDGRNLDQRMEVLRDSAATLDDAVAEWYLASGIDGRIDDGIAMARRLVLQWRQAAVLYDQGKIREAKTFLAKGDRTIDAIDGSQALILCPRL